MAAPPSVTHLHDANELNREAGLVTARLELRLSARSRRLVGRKRRC
jgi:hypothetical protein